MFIDLVSIDFQVSGRGVCSLACVLEDYIRKRPMGQTFFLLGNHTTPCLGAQSPESDSLSQSFNLISNRTGVEEWRKTLGVLATMG